MKRSFSTTIALAAVAWTVAQTVPTDARALQCHVGTFQFFPGGGIKSCRIEADHQFWTAKGERIVCARNSVLVQHENGAIARCTIPEPLVFGGTRCPAGSTVELHPDGGLKVCGKPD